jgi:uncharacterized protein (TIGR03435 family)
MRCGIILLAVAGVAALAGQEFDAASIKAVPCTGRCGGGGGVERLRFTPERVSNFPGGITARGIILEAYHLGAYQLSGGPAWLDSDRFALEAVTANPTDESQLRRMLQTLLAERFKLVMHRETSEMPVYFVTMGRKGTKLHERKDGEPPLALPPVGTGLALTTKMDLFIAHISNFGHIDRPVTSRPQWKTRSG